MFRSHHEMKRIAKHPDASEEWECLHCDRRILLRPGMPFRREVLEPGEELVPHHASISGVSLTVNREGAGRSVGAPAEEDDLPN